MTLSETILALSENYVIGISVLCVVVVAGYLFFSIRLIVTARREGLNICMSAMIPFVNLIIWFRKCLRKHKNNKIRRENSRVLAEDEEIEL